jgi:quercetin dioxygenase-like cupin family protein
MTRLKTLKVMTTAFVVVMGIAVTVISASVGQARQSPQPHHPAGADGHTVIGPNAMNWSPAGPGLSVAVLSGAPEKEGMPFVIRLKLANGTRVPPHWHPVDEHLTVVSGTFYMGVGERFDDAGATALTAGTYAMMPKDVRHFGWTGVDTVVQIHGVGPFKTYFVEQTAK